MIRFLFAVGTVAVLSSLTPMAQAASWATAVEGCQGSLPSFEGALRKRPLGINNEGNAPAFVSCGIRSDPFSRIDQVGVLATNRGSQAANFSCTFVDGIPPPNPFNPPIYQPKTVFIPAGDYALLRWRSADDNNGTLYRIVSLNCTLAPGMEINVLETS